METNLNQLLPREKAIQYGFASLSNQELLALVLKSGYKNNSVLDLAKQIIDKACGFNNLLSLSYEELINIKGVKMAKALEIQAILEIAKRLARLDKDDSFSLTSPEKVIDYLRVNLCFKNQESFFVIYLNGNNQVIKGEELFKGNKNTSVIGIDELLRKALLLKANGLLVAHNHPSGNVYPSSNDIQLTKQLAEACKIMQIPLIDHLILSKYDYFSFKNAKML